MDISLPSLFPIFSRSLSWDGRISIPSFDLSYSSRFILYKRQHLLSLIQYTFGFRLWRWRDDDGICCAIRRLVGGRIDVVECNHRCTQFYPLEEE